MPISPEQKKILLDTTKEAGKAFLEDIRYLRELIQKQDISSGEIRRSSAILRRLLVDGHITTIASPRIGKIEISAPDNKSIYKSISSNKVTYFFSGCTEIFGIQARAFMGADPTLHLIDFDPDRIVQLRKENFIAQDVIFWKNKWVKRVAVIKFIANVAHGVHSGTPQTDEELLLEDARYSIVMGRKSNGNIGINFRSPGTNYDEKKLDFVGTAIDIVLLEMFSCAFYLTISPAVVELENTLITEFS